jgi:hypothetical protein
MDEEEEMELVSRTVKMKGPHAKALLRALKKARLQHADTDEV